MRRVVETRSRRGRTAGCAGTEEPPGLLSSLRLDHGRDDVGPEGSIESTLGRRRSHGQVGLITPFQTAGTCSLARWIRVREPTCSTGWNASTTRCPATAPVRRSIGGAGALRPRRRRLAVLRPAPARRRPSRRRWPTSPRSARGSGSSALPEAFEWVHETTPGPAGRGPLGRADRAGGAADGARPGARCPTRRRCPTYRCGCSTRPRPASPPTSPPARAVAAVGFARRRHRAAATAGPAERGRRRAPSSDAAALERGARPGSPTAGGSSRAGRDARPRASLASGMAMRVGRRRGDRRGGHPAAARRRGLRRRGSPPPWPGEAAAPPAPTWSSSPPAARTIARVYLRVGFRRIGTACIAEPAAAHRR